MTFKCIAHGVQKKMRPKCLLAISSKKLRRFWWKLVHSFLNKFAAKSFTTLPPHPNNVSTLPCKSWNAHRANAIIELLDRKTLEYCLSPQLRPQIRQIRNQLITACEEYCKRRCTTRITDLDELNSDWDRSVKLDQIFNAAAIRHSSVISARASRLAVDILSTVSDFRYCSVSDFCCRWWRHEQKMRYLYWPLNSCILYVLALWCSNRPHSDLFIFAR